MVIVSASRKSSSPRFALRPLNQVGSRPSVRGGSPPDDSTIRRVIPPWSPARLTWVFWLGFASLAHGGTSPRSKAGESTPTYTKDVAPILQKKCQNCHRKNQIGPFSLETYEQARKRASDIASVVSERLMPPWKPAPGVGPKLKHDQSLSHEEIATLEAWASGGAPQGDKAHLPPPPEFVEGWKLGPPDLVLEPDQSLTIPAAGPDLYRCFVLPTNLKRDLYLSAVDFQPGNSKVVHHINAFVDTSGEARKHDKADPKPGYESFNGPGILEYQDLSFWAGGHSPCHLPNGIGQRLNRQSDIILQIHYHPTGKKETDRTKVGLYFSRHPVKQALHWTTISNTKFRVPAGNANYEVKSTWFTPVELEVLAVSPHMHGLGRDMRMSATLPNGKTQDLIQIPSWDPSWQSAYYFQHPIALPSCSVVKVVAHFDNSDHPRNPNRPPKPISYGSNANDEMCEGFIAVVKKGQDLTLPHARDDLAEILVRQRIKNLLRSTARRTR